VLFKLPGDITISMGINGIPHKRILRKSTHLKLDQNGIFFRSE